MKQTQITRVKRSTLLFGAAISSVACSWSFADSPTNRLPTVEKPGANPAAVKYLKQGEVEGLFASFKKMKAEQAAQQSSQPQATQPIPTRWLRSKSSTASREIASRMLAQAAQEFEVKAWASAEETCWKVLEQAATGIELQQREQTQGNIDWSPIEDLDASQTSIREARDFVQYNHAGNPVALRRMIQSHQTNLLKEVPVSALNPTDAVDRYLDDARIRLGRIASGSVEAAQAMDLLAAVHLSRADTKSLPSSTALCLRRAALQGQPRNASLAMRLGMHLADLGLYQEARWALDHSVKLEPTQEAAVGLAKVLQQMGHSNDARVMLNANYDIQTSSQPTVPKITQLTPEQFAAISSPVMQPQTRLNTKPVMYRHRTAAANQSAEVTDVQPKKPSLMQQIYETIKSPW